MWSWVFVVSLLCSCRLVCSLSKRQPALVRGSCNHQACGGSKNQSHEQPFCRAVFQLWLTSPRVVQMSTPRKRPPLRQGGHMIASIEAAKAAAAEAAAAKAAASPPPLPPPSAPSPSSRTSASLDASNEAYRREMNRKVMLLNQHMALSAAPGPSSASPASVSSFASSDSTSPPLSSIQRASGPFARSESKSKPMDLEVSKASNLTPLDMCSLYVFCRAKLLQRPLNQTRRQSLQAPCTRFSNGKPRLQVLDRALSSR